MSEATMMRICGLWEHTTKDRRTYLTGPLSYGARLLILPNGNKRPGVNDPDAYVYVVSRGTTGYVATWRTKDEEADHVQAAKAVHDGATVEAEDDLPF